MKPKSILYVSAALNLILVVVFLVRGPLNESEEASRGPKWSPKTSESDEGGLTDAVRGDAMNGDNGGRDPSFRWKQIESPDYAKYVKNLRSVGCPEATIRDIVEADINELFEPRYYEALRAIQGFDYWREGPEALAQQEALRGQLLALDEERVEVLRELLGEDFRSRKSLVSLSRDDLIDRAKWGFLDPDKQRQVADIMAEFSVIEREIRLEWEGPDNAIGLRALLDENRDARREMLASLLTEDELFELELRDSSAVTALRRKLGDFEVSEEEFRELFGLRQAFELEHGSVPGRSGREAFAAQSTALQEMEGEFQSVLGGDRHTDLQRQRDSDWQKLKELETTQDLSREAMEAAYALRQEAGREVIRAMSDQDLDEVEREALAAAARAQYGIEMDALLGETAAGELGALREARTIRISTGGLGSEAPMFLIPEAGVISGTVSTLFGGSTDAATGAQIIETQVAPLGNSSTSIIIEADAVRPSPSPGP